jgi:hypothetical protein
MAGIERNTYLAVNGVTESVHDATEHLRANGHIDNLTSELDSVAFPDLGIVTENDDTDVVGLQVQGHTLRTPTKERLSSTRLEQRRK